MEFRGRGRAVRFAVVPVVASAVLAAVVNPAASVLPTWLGWLPGAWTWVLLALTSVVLCVVAVRHERCALRGAVRPGR